MSSADEAGPPSIPRRKIRFGWLLIAVTVVLLVAMVGLYLRAAARTNRVALSQSPKPVTVARAESGKYQSFREYVGILDPWNEASVGPQYVSAYVETVRFRPGAVVRRGEILATLDCRFATASSREIAAQSRGIAVRQGALADEAERVQEMARGGFASQNDVEQLHARAAFEREQIRSSEATLVTRRIAVRDCTLRAPFDGDIVSRFVDPGAWVRPGQAALGIADRSILRAAADAPESDYELVAPGTGATIEIEALHSRLSGYVARRTPATERGTRTVHFEIDIPNRARGLPSGATARVRIAVGAPAPATVIPLQAAVVRGEQATLFLVEQGIARRRSVRVLGEREGRLYLASSLPAGSEVVLEGRALLRDGERVTVQAVGGGGLE